MAERWSFGRLTTASALVRHLVLGRLVEPAARAAVLASARRQAPGLTISRSTPVSRHARFDGANITVGADCRLHPTAVLESWRGHITIGSHVYVGPYAVLYGHGGLDIGDDTRIASHVVIIPANHVYADPAVPIRGQGETRLGVRIGSDVWLGAGVVVLDGVTIGDGAVVGAGAVVTRDVPPLAVVVGVPARQVGLRGA